MAGTMKYLDLSGLSYLIQKMNSKRSRVLISDYMLEYNRFVADTSFAEYPYKYTYNDPNISSSTICEVIFEPNACISGDFAPFCISSDGGVDIFCKTPNPIPITIMIWQ